MPSPTRMPQSGPAATAREGGTVEQTVLRFGLFLFVWVVVHGGWSGLPVGAMAAAAATGGSLAILPPAKARLALGPLLRLAFAFPLQSLRAGFDVARRAMAPSLPLSPGIVPCPTGLPDGIEREAFHAYMSLQPGTLPVAMRGEKTLLVHTLDTSAPVVEVFSEEEEGFCRLRERPGNG